LNNNLDINSSEDSIDFSYYISVIVKHLWILIMFIFIGVVIATAVNVFTQPVYKASVLMMIDRETAGRIDTTTFGSWASDEDYYRTQYKLLESKSLLQKIHNNLNLNQYPEFANPNGWVKLKRRLKIEPVTRSRLVNLEVSSFDKNLTAQIANTLAKTFCEDNITNRSFITQDIIAALESTVKNQQQQELLNSIPQVVNSDFIKNLKNKEIALQEEYAKLIAKYTTNHPNVISVENQLKVIREKIDIETKRLIQSIKIDLSGKFAGNNIRIIDEATVPDNPYLPRKLINLLIGVVAGGIIAILIIFMIEFLDKSIKSSEDLEKELDLSFLGFVPTEKLKKGTKEYSFMLNKDNPLYAEQIRNIRVMLNFTLANFKDKAFLITSSVQSEGKTNLSTNLSVAMAQTGSKVLIVDGDLRRARLHKAFDLPLRNGVSDILSFNEKDGDLKNFIESKFVKKTEIENLSVITAGINPPNPSELLSREILGKFIEWATSNFDIVLIDTPAILPVNDTLLWGKYINRTIFTIRHGKTSTKMAKVAIEKIIKANIKILGGIITYHKKQGIATKESSYYYYSYRNKKKN